VRAGFPLYFSKNSEPPGINTFVSSYLIDRTFLLVLGNIGEWKKVVFLVNSALEKKARFPGLFYSADRGMLAISDRR
jgi:hypothetical protein